MKLYALTFAAAILSTAAVAQRGIQIEDYDGDRIRVGAACSLYLFGQKLAGTCTVGKMPGSRTSRVLANGVVYRIVRDDGDKTSARWMKGDAFMERVYAAGNCWVGENVRFCAR
jgi:hypothetical protein